MGGPPRGAGEAAGGPGGRTPPAGGEHPRGGVAAGAGTARGLGGGGGEAGGLTLPPGPPQRGLAEGEAGEPGRVRDRRLDRAAGRAAPPGGRPAGLLLARGRAGLRRAHRHRLQRRGAGGPAREAAAPGAPHAALRGGAGHQPARALGDAAAGGGGALQRVDERGQAAPAGLPGPAGRPGGGRGGARAAGRGASAAGGGEGGGGGGRAVTRSTGRRGAAQPARSAAGSRGCGVAARWATRGWR